jgi:hypothetical protein
MDKEDKSKKVDKELEDLKKFYEKFGDSEPEIRGTVVHEYHKYPCGYCETCKHYKVYGIWENTKRK